MKRNPSPSSRSWSDAQALHVVWALSRHSPLEKKTHGWAEPHALIIVAINMPSTSVEPVSFHFKPGLYTATRILKIFAQRRPRELAGHRPKIRKNPSQRLDGVSLTRGNVAPIFVARTWPTETGLAG